MPAHTVAHKNAWIRKSLHCGKAQLRCPGKRTAARNTRRAAAHDVDEVAVSSAAADNSASTVAVGGTVLGAAGLVTGSTVGAGILALPAVTHSTGFAPSATLLLISWVLLQVEAFIIAELNVHCHETRVASGDADGRVIPLAAMTRTIAGPATEAAVTSVYLCLTFTLLLAYIARGGGLLGSALDHLPPLAALPGGLSNLGLLAFSSTLGAVFAFGGTKATERLNSALTTSMLTLFVGIVGVGAQQVDWSGASGGLGHADWSGALDCVPVMFLALVYHDLIPVVCQYLGFDRTKIKRALGLGSIIPLGMFLAWQAVALGLVPFVPGISVDPVDELIATQGSVGGSAVAVFSLAALATSAIGTMLSLSSFLEPKISTLLQGSRSDSDADPAAADVGSVAHCVATILTLAPPTLASMGNPAIFATATHVAGAYGMTLLYGVLPPALAWRLRGLKSRTSSSRSQPRGRKIAARPVLAGLMSAGIVVEVLQLASDFPMSSSQESALEVAQAIAQQPVYQIASTMEPVLTSAAVLDVSTLEQLSSSIVQSVPVEVASQIPVL